jgi:putative multiple sugar transport system permease protein
LLVPINVSRLILQNSYILILAVGMVLCILTGGNIDLAVGSIVALVSASSALFSITLGISPIISILLGLILGLLAGMWQGFWIAYVRIPPFIVTLAGMLIFRGINNIILSGQTILLPELYKTIASDVIPDIFANGSGLHITTVIIGFICAIAYVAMEILRRKQKIRLNFEVESSQLFLAKIIVIAAIIILFAYWLARAEGLPYVVILLIFLIVVYTFITTRTVAGRHVYALEEMQKQLNCRESKQKKLCFGLYKHGIIIGCCRHCICGTLEFCDTNCRNEF